MTTDAMKEAEQLTANCTHGMEFAETAEHYADLRTRIRACIGYQIEERNKARNECRCSFHRSVGELLEAIASADKDAKNGFDTLASAEWDNVLRLAAIVRQERIGAQQ